MATYEYTGVLADFSQAPFPGAHPKLEVVAKQAAFGPLGPLADKPVRVPVAASGAFTVTLVASADTTPPTTYELRCTWLNDDDTPVGWSEWTFTAVVAGGPIKDMVTAPPSVWFIGPPWPASEPSGFYWDTTTDDVWRKE